MKIRLKAKFFIFVSLIGIAFFIKFIFHEEMIESRHYTYEIVSHKKEINTMNKEGYDFYLNCRNELGLFCFNVTRETYYDNKDNGLIKFEGGFTVYKLYEYAQNIKTKEKVLETINDKDIKSFVKLEMRGAEIMAMIVFGLMLCVSVLSHKGVFDE